MNQFPITCKQPTIITVLSPENISSIFIGSSDLSKGRFHNPGDKYFERYVNETLKTMSSGECDVWLSRGSYVMIHPNNDTTKARILYLKK